MTFNAMTPEGANVAPLIDHTLLKTDATPTQIVSLCTEAKHYGFASVCVNPLWLEAVVHELDGSAVKSCVVLDFPLGACPASVKAHEAREYTRLGADELDMVMPVGLLKAGQHDLVRAAIQAVTEAAHGKTVKVIIETCLLTDCEKVTACELSVEGGAQFVKTSTGFAHAGATVEDVRLMRETVRDACGVKASGGIRTLDDALAMIDAGANRLGTSSGVAIVT